MAVSYDRSLGHPSLTPLSRLLGRLNDPHMLIALCVLGGFILGAAAVIYIVATAKPILPW